MSSPAGGHRDNFGKFFESWLIDQDRDLQSLLAAAADLRLRSDEEEAAQNCRLCSLLATVLAHYEHYYRAKKASARRNVLPMFNPTWTSSTENLFLWAGGWRPAMAFHLLYSKCGIQVESHLSELVRGSPTWDLADLDAEQLCRIDQLHRKVVWREKEISEEEAVVQEKLADEPLVRLSNIITEMGGGDGCEMMEEEMQEKKDSMREVLEMADCLRIETLKGVVEILRPMQAVHFLIAAAELHLRVHEFGVKKDAETMAAAPTRVPAAAAL